jgi:hypothetical protein
MVGKVIDLRNSYATAIIRLCASATKYLRLFLGTGKVA